MLAAYERAAHPPCQLQDSDWSADPTTPDFSGQVQINGRIHNSCAEPLDVEIDNRILDGSQQPTGDAPTAFINGLAPGKSAPYSTWAEGVFPVGKWAVLAVWGYHKVGLRDSGGCFDVGASQCLKADIWLSGTISRLQETALGRQLLHTAADYGVQVLRDRPPFGSYAVFDRSSKTIKIDPLLDKYSAWERAAVLSHELRHASDAASGMNMDTTDGCYRTEQNAFTDEAQVWIGFWQNKLPRPANSVQSELNNIALTLARDPYAFIGNLLTSYKHQCGG
jgi:hypothetical protein